MEAGDEEMEAGNGEEEVQHASSPPPPSQEQQQPAASQQQQKKRQKKATEYPCLACGKNVTGASVQCTMCTLWCHKACTNLSAEAYKGLEVQAKEVGTAYWACRSCMTFANKMNRQFQAVSKRQDEMEEKMDGNIRETKQNSQEIEKLREELNRMRSTLESEREAKNDMLGEELRDRETRRNNIIIHGLQETDVNTNPRDRMERDKQLCGELLAAIGARTRAVEQESG
jgi:hypothetical protein